MMLFSTKYRSLMFITLMFLIFISAVSIFTIYISTSIERENRQIVALQDAKITLQETFKDMYELRLNYGADPRTVHIQTLLQRVTQNSEFFSQFSEALVNHRIIERENNSGIAFDADLAGLKNLIDASHSIWQELNQNISAYTQVAGQIDVDAEPLLATAINGLNRSGEQITNNMNEVVSAAEQKSARTIERLRLIQIATLVATLIFFVAFLFFLIKRILQADTIAEEARRETANIMKTVKEGLFLLDSNLSIGQQYSAELENIIGQSRIGGRHLSDLLEATVSKEDYQLTQDFIDQLFNEEVIEELIYDLNPLDRVKVFIHQSEHTAAPARYLSFVFTRVYEGERIINVLASVTDITNEVLLEQRLERERQQHDEQIELLSSILQIDAAVANAFISHVDSASAKINNALKQSSMGKGHGLKNKANMIFREVHSMKGEASALGLQRFVTIAEDMESRIAALLRKPGLTGRDFLSLTIDLDKLITLNQEIKRLHQTVSGANSETTLQTIVAPASNSKNDVSYAPWQDLVKQVSERQGKVATLHVDGWSLFAALNHEKQAQLNEVVIQLLRNAVVHGIEQPDVRRAAGKPEQGNIYCRFRQDDAGNVLVEVRDDGRGIDFNALRQKGTAEGYFKGQAPQEITRHMLLSYMFRTGVSTTTHSQDAGRGVGMDIVRDRIKDLKGKISIHSEKGKQSVFRMMIPA